MPESPTRLPDPFSTYEHRVVITFFYVLAIFITLSRLARRICIRRFSWDDSWAAFALVLLVVKMVVEWLWFGNDATLGSDAQVFFSLQTGLFSGIVWASRVSLAISVVRILPPGRLRNTAICVAVACFLFGTMLVTLKRALCTVQFTPSGPRPTCAKGRLALILQTTGDVVSSTVLVLFPLYALSLTSAELPSHERRLIYALFASTVLTLVACLAQTIFVFKKDRFAMSYSAALEASISLMVCNLLVVVTFLYRLLSPKREDGEEENNSGEDTVTLTTFARDGHTSTTVTRSGYMDTSQIPTDSRYSILTQLTEVMEIQTYSLPSLDMATTDYNTPGWPSGGRG